MFRSLPANPVIQAKALVTDVTLTRWGARQEGDETIRFTNIPMERVHAAIAVLNDDAPTTVAQPYADIATRNLEAIREASKVEIKRTRTEDFTVGELFPDGAITSTSYCTECGSHIIPNKRERHTTWHNKLLP